jgi:hypothetical protein
MTFTFHDMHYPTTFTFHSVHYPTTFTFNSVHSPATFTFHSVHSPTTFTFHSSPSPTTLTFHSAHSPTGKINTVKKSFGTKKLSFKNQLKHCKTVIGECFTVYVIGPSSEDKMCCASSENMRNNVWRIFP